MTRNQYVLYLHGMIAIILSALVLSIAACSFQKNKEQTLNNMEVTDRSYTIRPYVDGLANTLSKTDSVELQAKTLTLLCYLGEIYGLGEDAQSIPFAQETSYSSSLRTTLSNGRPPTTEASMFGFSIDRFPLLSPEDLVVEELESGLLRVRLGEVAKSRLPSSSYDAVNWYFFKRGWNTVWQLDTKTGRVVNPLNSMSEAMDYADADWNADNAPE